MVYLVRLLKILTLPFVLIFFMSITVTFLCTGLGYILFGNLEKTFEMILKYADKYENWF
jgi:hypothetical protein